jgi:hypothetical protein
MAKRASWFARVFGLDGSEHDDDGVASFERIDGSRLGAGEFHLSDSMRLDDAVLADFSETLPAFSRMALQLADRRPSGRPH